MSSGPLTPGTGHAPQLWSCFLIVAPISIVPVHYGLCPLGFSVYPLSLALFGNGQRMAHVGSRLAYSTCFYSLKYKNAYYSLYFELSLLFLAHGDDIIKNFLNLLRADSMPQCHVHNLFETDFSPR